MRVGEIVGDRFRIDRLVATSPSGTVFFAIDTSGGPPVALKLHGAPAAAAREARILGRVRSAGVVPLVAHGDGWLAAEWLEGETLADRLALGPLTPAETVALAAPTADALAAVHAAGFVHRDVKPQNLFLVGRRLDRVCLVDFGVACAADNPPSPAPVGTPGYFAPEQSGGRRVDARADLFSLGAVIFRCLTGRLPEGGRRAGSLRAGVPPSLDALVETLLDPDPERRPPDAATVARALRDADLVGGEIVGREREVASLETALAAALGSARAASLVVTGDAGIGKSRLRQEALVRARERFPSLRIWIGRGDPVRAGVPLGILVDTIRDASGVRADDGARAAREKVEARAGRTLAAFVSAESRPRTRREAALVQGDRFRRACEDFFEAESAKGPLLVVLEDLHWSDPVTPAFFGAILRRLADRPLVVLGLSRTVAPLGALAQTAALHVSLDSIADDPAERIVRRVLGPGADRDLVARLVRRGAGSPLHLEELARAHEKGEGSEADDVQATLRVRLEALPPLAKRAVGAASVFGRTFPVEGVAAVLETDAAGAADALATSELVATRSATGDAAFRHELLRAAAYAAMGEDERARAHRSAAEWLERTGRAEAAVLAEHHEAAGERGRAVREYRLAAEEALSASDFESVLRWTDRAVVCGAAGDVLGDVRLLEAEARRWRGEYEPALALAREALSLLPRGSALWCHAGGEAAFASTSLGGRAALIELADALAPDLAEGATAAAILAASRFAAGLLVVGEIERADALLSRVEGRATPALLEEPLAASRLHAARAIRYAHAGDVAGQLAWADKSVAAADAAGDERAACGYRTNLGFACWQLGLYERAREVLERALAGAERLGLESVMASTRQNLAMTFALGGRGDDAIPILRDVAERFAAQRYLRFEGGSRLYLALLLAERGDVVEAEAEATKAVEVLAGIDPARAAALAVLSRTLDAARRPAEALEVARRAMALMDSLGGIEHETLVRLAFVEALLASGEASEAIDALRIARDRLLERAARIGDPALRQSFLDRVPDNARTMALAAQHLAG